MTDRNILIDALKAVMPVWEQEKLGQTLLTQRPSNERVLNPLAAAIDRCTAFKAVAGRSLFSANAGAVLHSGILALRLLYQADWVIFSGRDVSAAADWLLRILTTRKAHGLLKAAIWGLSVDREVKLSNRTRLTTFADLPSSDVKKRIGERAQKQWKDAVWMSERFFVEPSAALIQKVPNFPYIRADSASFNAMQMLERDAYDLLVFLQGKAAGRPLAFASWLEYEDPDLDFNAFENRLSWMVPEVAPTIWSSTAIDAAAIRRDIAVFSAFSAEWRTDLARSMERFTLSQCRRQRIDSVLDLALAFEIATSGGENVPVSWKVSVRTSQLIGGPLATRQENRRKINDLFKLRNRATHGSRLKLSDREKHDLIWQDAVHLYQELLGKFFKLKKKPDWDSIELEPVFKE
jgi:hypothetical protein